jgi:hypothetical protein
VGAGAGEAGLNLVGDVQAAGRVHDLGDRREEAGRIREQPVGREDRVGEKGGEPVAVTFEVRDRPGDGSAEVDS